MKAEEQLPGDLAPRQRKGHWTTNASSAKGI